MSRKRARQRPPSAGEVFALEMRRLMGPPPVSPADYPGAEAAVAWCEELVCGVAPSFGLTTLDLVRQDAAAGVPLGEILTRMRACFDYTLANGLDLQSLGLADAAVIRAQILHPLFARYLARKLDTNPEDRS